MNREILFRGKRVDNGEWVFGSLWNNGDSCVIIDTGGVHWEVLPETVGQFTGLLDKNGTKIFEGDKVRILYTDWPSKSSDDNRTIEEYMNDIAVNGVIEFKDCEFGVHICSDILDSIFPGRHGFIEITGNIHD